MKNTIENRLKQRDFQIQHYNLTIKEYPEVNVVIGMGIEKNKPIALAFTGTKGKPEFSYSFKSEEDREKYIEKFINEQRKNIEYKQERKEKKKAPKVFELPFKPGDIIYNSWGYEQTNIDFYQVIRCTKSSVFIQPIKAEFADRATGNEMSAYLRPLKDNFLENSFEIRKKIQWYDGNAYINFEFGGCSEYKDGDEIYCSWYA